MCGDRLFTISCGDATGAIVFVVLVGSFCQHRGVNLFSNKSVIVYFVWQIRFDCLPSVISVSGRKEIEFRLRKEVSNT